MTKIMKVVLGAFLLLLSSSIAEVVYENNFQTGAGNKSVTVAGWAAYVTDDDGSVSDESILMGPNSGPDATFGAGVTTYIFAVPKNMDAIATNTTSLMFCTDLVSPVSLVALESISLDERYDGSAADPAEGRIVIQIGSDWYASSYNWTRNVAAPPAYANRELSGIDFTDGANWLNMTAIVGDAGVGEISLGSAVVGSLTGDITAFGVYAEHGNAGDHTRVDNFQVNAVAGRAYYVASAATDWTDPAAWSDGAAATAGVTYYVTNNVALNTPAVTAAFPGDALNLVGSQRIDLMVSGINEVITIDPLTLDADTVAAGVVDSDVAQIDGALMVVSNSTFSGASDNSRDLRVLAAVSGSTQLELSAPTKTIYIDNTNNTFSGTWVVSGGTAEFASPAAIGSASIEVQSNGTLRILGDWDGYTKGDSLTVADSPSALVDIGTNAWTVTGLMIGTNDVAEGSTYTALELNALGVNPVFTGSGTIQVGPPPPPPQPMLLVGWERWVGGLGASCPATIETNGITGVAVNGGFDALKWGGSNDGTFGTLLSPTASTDTTINEEGMRVENALEISFDFTVGNTSGDPVDLGAFHFDALTKTKTGGPDTWTLEVVSGDLSIGVVTNGALPYIGATGNLADFDVGLAGLADNVLDAGGSVLFRLTFSGGTPATTGATRLDMDNVAVTKVLSLVPTEPAVMSIAASGADVVISWPESGFKLQTKAQLSFGDWVDYPGGDVSPVTVPATKAAEFYRLIVQ